MKTHRYLTLDLEIVFMLLYYFPYHYIYQLLLSVLFFVKDKNESDFSLRYLRSENEPN